MHVCSWILKGQMYLYNTLSIKLESDILNISWDTIAYWHNLLLPSVYGHWIQG